MEQNSPGNLNSSPAAEEAALIEQKPEPPVQTPENLGRFPLKLLGLLAVLLILVIIPGLIFLNRKEAKKQSKEELAASFSQPDRITPPFIRCPVVPDECARGQTVEEDVDGQKVYALRFSPLVNGTQVFAAMAGERTVEPDNSLLITNTERGIELRYVLDGEFKYGDENATAYTDQNTIGIFTGEGNTLTLLARSIKADQPVRLGVGRAGDFLTNLD